MLSAIFLAQQNFEETEHKSSLAPFRFQSGCVLGWNLGSGTVDLTSTVSRPFPRAKSAPNSIWSVLSAAPGLVVRPPGWPTPCLDVLDVLSTMKDANIMQMLVVGSNCSGKPTAYGF